MPLDFATKASLVDHLQWSGISPVPDIVLEQHKKAEVDKHPADWGYHHIKALHSAIGLVFAMTLLGLLTGAVINNFYGAILAFVATLGLLGLVVGLLQLEFHHRAGGTFGKFKGPATWHEENFGYLRGDTYRMKDRPTATAIPSDILRVARHAHAHVPNSWFVVGELRQETKLLDPYILVCTETERVCIGIWDGQKIIHIAQTV